MVKIKRNLLIPLISIICMSMAAGCNRPAQVDILPRTQVAVETTATPAVPPVETEAAPAVPPVETEATTAVPQVPEPVQEPASVELTTELFTDVVENEEDIATEPDTEMRDKLYDDVYNWLLRGELTLTDERMFCGKVSIALLDQAELFFYWAYDYGGELRIGETGDGAQVRFVQEFYQYLVDCDAPINLAAEHEPFDTLILIDVVKGNAVGQWSRNGGGPGGTAYEYTVHASIINIADKTVCVDRYVYWRMTLCLNQPPKTWTTIEGLRSKERSFTPEALNAFINYKGIIQLHSEYWYWPVRTAYEDNKIMVMESKSSDQYVGSFTENFTPEQLYDLVMGDIPNDMTMDELYEFVTQGNIVANGYVIETLLGSLRSNEQE